MNNIYFWKNWNTPYKQLYFFLLSIFLFSIAALSYSSYVGIEAVAKWDVETELEPAKVVIDQFAKNFFNFTVDSESFYALDKFVTTEIRSDLVISYVYLGVIILAVVFIVTTFSFLDLYWYMGGMLGFLFFLFSLKIEMLQLFGRIDRLPMVLIFLTYGGVSFVFNMYYKSATYLLRLISFSLLTIAIAIIIYFYAYVPTPFLYLANFGSLFPVTIAILFVLLVGHDIIKGLLYVVSSQKTAGGKNAALNFVLASMLYLVNVLLLLLKKLTVLDLNIIYLNPFFLLVVSSVLGIWMFKKRTEMFSTVLPFAPAGAYVYLSLAVITLAGASYAFITGNIGIIHSYERIIVYGHLFVGFVFLIYVLVNFLTYFDKKISIYDNIYKPERMTFLVVPSIAITISVFFFIYQKKYPYNLAMAGYYSYAGDVMVYEGDYTMAFQYYKEAVLYDYPNHRANYSIAALCSATEDEATAKGYYTNAIIRDPSVQAYVGLSNAQFKSGELFEALFTVQEGLKKYPGEGRLYNNLAVLYYKSNLADSAVHYFLRAKQTMNEKQVASSNILYLLAKKNLIAEADSILQTENYPEHISFANNKLTIYNLIGKKSDSNPNLSFFKDSTLTANTYAYLVNSNLNSLHDTSSVLLRKIDFYNSKPSNERYKDNLLGQLALRKYYRGDRFSAIQDMIQLNVTSSQSPEYANFLGAWMLEQEEYQLASEYYKTAIERGKRGNEINYAFSALMSGDKEDALFILSQLNDKDLNHIYNSMITLINTKGIDKLQTLDETQQLQWFLYNLNTLTAESATKLYTAVVNPRGKVYAGAALCQYFIRQNDLAKAQAIFSEIEAIQELNTYAEKERNYTYLLLQTALKKGDVLTEKSRALSLSSDKEMMRNYFIASAYEYTGDSANASVFYLNLLKEVPYSSIVVPKAVSYLSKHGFQQQAYDYLVEIVHNDPSVEMKKTYLDLCLDMSLLSYAESTLAELKGRIASNDFLSYQKRLLAVQQE